MDYHALQQKLFEIDPADPAEDIRKMTQMANQAPQESVQPIENIVQESVQVQEGTMPVEGDYSLNDFAKLAGVQLNERAFDKQIDKGLGVVGGGAEKVVKKVPGGGAFVDGFKKGFKDPDKLTTAVGAAKDEYDKYKKPNKDEKKKPKTVQDYKDEYNAKQNQKESLNFDQDSLIEAISQELDEILPAIAGMAARGLAAKAVGGAVDKLTANKKNKQKPIKARDPNAQYMNDLRKSGAAGDHKDKTKTIPRKQKHKDTNESIKSQLWAALNSKK
jgi:hypothetical protein